MSGAAGEGLGRLRPNIPLLLEAPERGADGMGGFILNWRSLGVLYARMAAVAAGERAGEAGAESAVRWRITIRAAREGDPRRPRPDQRLRMGARIFRIDAVAEADGRGLWLDCMATEEKAG